MTVLLKNTSSENRLQVRMQDLHSGKNDTGYDDVGALDDFLRPRRKAQWDMIYHMSQYVTRWFFVFMPLGGIMQT